MRTNGGVAVVAAMLAGCLGSAPALLTGDAGPDATKVETQTGVDATTESGMVGVSTDDGSTDGAVEDGGVGDAQGVACFEGGPCSPGPCELGKTTCSASGAQSCAVSQNVTNGTGCDAGDAGYAVCDQGACQLCNAGGDCTEAGSCQQMNVVCTSGGAACKPMGNVTDGKSCGTNLFCNSGSCAACTPDAGCAPTTKPCNVGTVSCVGGQVVCNDQMTPAPDGKSCGTNMVCKSGSCTACTANVQCTPPGQPCHTGLTSCATGTSVCVDMGNVQDNTLCSGSNLCFGSYACQSGTCTGLNPVTCTASDQCHSAGTCNPATGTCSNPVATGASCSDGNGCTTGDTCASSGMCGGTAVSCPASDACHTAGTCSSTGATSHTCSNPPAGSGTACGTNMTCDGAGTCRCASGFMSCSGVCVNESSDNANCGVCNHNCVHPNSCSTGSCQSWIVAHTNGTTGYTHVLASDGTNLVWLDGSGAVEQVPLAGGTPITLGTIASGYTPACIALASGVVAWTAYVSPTSTNPFGGAGAVFTAVESSANSGRSTPVATDNDSAAVGAYGLALKSNGTSAYYLNTGGQSNVEACTLGGLSGSCSNIDPYTAGLVADDLIINGSTIYWTSFSAGTVSSQTIGSTTVNSIATGEGGPSVLATDSTYVYWGNTSPSGTASFTIDRNPQTGGNPAASTNVLGSTTGQVMSLATDGKYVYYAGTAGSTGIGYVPVGGGSGTPLVTTTGGGVPTVIYVGGAIYWANTDDKTIRGMAVPP